MAGGGDGRSLQETPTWAVASVCFVLVVISVIIEHIIHLIGKVSCRNPSVPNPWFRSVTVARNCYVTADTNILPLALSFVIGKILEWLERW